MKTLILFLVAIISSSSLIKAAGVPVVDALANTRETTKFIWEKIQWADKLKTLHDTLQATQDQLRTANAVKSAIGDPSSVGSFIDVHTFSNLLQWNGIPHTLSTIEQLLAKGRASSDTINALYNEPIDIEKYVNSNQYTDISAFRDPNDPLKRYRAVENAYGEFENTISKAQRKRTVLNKQIARLNSQLKGAKTDAEVQKLQGSLAATQAAFSSLDQMEAQSAERVKLLIALNENRAQMEQAAYADINRKLDEKASQKASEATKALLKRKL